MFSGGKAAAAHVYTRFLLFLSLPLLFLASVTRPEKGRKHFHTNTKHVQVAHGLLLMPLSYLHLSHWLRGERRKRMSPHHSREMHLFSRFCKGERERQRQGERVLFFSCNRMLQSFMMDASTGETLIIQGEKWETRFRRVRIHCKWIIQYIATSSKQPSSA